jgi:RNA polymerase sigma factor (sigma-70 family)
MGATENTLEGLLENTASMKGLARGLVRDPHRVEDLVQDAAVALLQKRSGAIRSPGSWLRGVLGKLASRARRDDERRRRREGRVATLERVTESPEGVLERAELRRTILDAVLALEEPYRTTVLLRFFEEKSVRAIARELGLPAATVRTRLARALERLRRRLDRLHGGDRSAWCAVLVPLLGWKAAVAGGGWGSAGVGSGMGTGTAGAAWGSMNGFSCMGGMVMSGKTLAAVGAVGLATIAVGFGLGHTAFPPRLDGGELARLLLERPEHLALLRSRDALEAEVEQARAERDRALREQEAAAHEAAALREDLARAEKAGADAAAEARGIPVAFGKFADLDGIRGADWKEAGEATASIRELAADLLQAIQEGQPLGDLQARLAVENAKLRRLGGAIEGKIPTHASRNGEETHPLVLANLMGALLENAGVPFDPRQVESIARLGDEFEAEYDRLQASYDDGTPALAKVIDELDLKRQFMRNVQGLLGEGQASVLASPGVEDGPQDPLSPLRMVDPKLWMLPDLAALREVLHSKGAMIYGIGEGIAPSLEGPFDTWFQAMQAGFRPLPSFENMSAYSMGPRLEEVAAMGRAQAEFLRQAAAAKGLDEAALRAILSDTTLIFPVSTEGRHGG